MLFWSSLVHAPQSDWLTFNRVPLKNTDTILLIQRWAHMLNANDRVCVSVCVCVHWSLWAHSLGCYEHSLDQFFYSWIDLMSAYGHRNGCVWNTAPISLVSMVVSRTKSDITTILAILFIKHINSMCLRHKTIKNRLILEQSFSVSLRDHWAESALWSDSTSVQRGLMGLKTPS